MSAYFVSMLVFLGLVAVALVAAFVLPRRDGRKDG